jgi:hypothetical protein
MDCQRPESFVSVLSVFDTVAISRRVSPSLPTVRFQAIGSDGAVHTATLSNAQSKFFSWTPEAESYLTVTK